MIDNKEEALHAIEYRFFRPFEHISERLQNDKDVVVAAMKCGVDGVHWKYREHIEQFAKDRELVLLAVQNGEEVPEIHRNDEEIVLAAIRAKNFHAYESATDFIKNNRTMALEAMQIYDHNGFNICLQSAPDNLKDDKEIVMEAIKHSEFALELASVRLKDDKEIVKMAKPVKRGIYRLWSRLDHASERLQNDRDVVLDVAKKDDFIMKSLSDQFREDDEVIMTALKHSCLNFKGAPEKFLNDRELVIEVFQSDPLHIFDAFHFISQSLRNDKEVILAAVKVNGRVLDLASKELKASKDIVLAAVKQNGYHIRYVKYAAPSFLKDQEIILAAVRSFGPALEHASKKLRNCKKVVLAAINGGREGCKKFRPRIKDGLPIDAVLDFASDRLKNDKEVVLQAVRRSGRALLFASDKLKDDKEVVYEAVKKNFLAFELVSERLKNDQEIAAEAVKNDFRAFRFVPEVLQNDVEVLILTICSKIRIKSEILKEGPMKWQTDHPTESLYFYDEVDISIDELIQACSKMKHRTPSNIMVTVSKLRLVWHYGMKELSVAYLDGLRIADEMTGLYPFMLSASENINGSFDPDLNTIFNLVKMNPELVKFHNSSTLTMHDSNDVNVLGSRGTKRKLDCNNKSFCEK